MKKHILRWMLLWLAAGVISLCFSGCNSLEQNQSEAVDRARKYLLENARDLTPEETARIQFTDPVLLIGDIFTSNKSYLDLAQICIAWPMANGQDYYLVYGASTTRMSDWRPIQFLRKNFSKESEPLIKATEEARNYMFDSLYPNLLTLEINHVRFMFPAVLETDFALTLDPDTNRDNEKIEIEKETLSKQKQFSLVWATPGREPLVFCGTAREDLEGWKLNFAGHMPPEMLKKHTLKLVRRADQENVDFVSAEKIRQLDRQDLEKEKARRAEEQKKLEESVEKHFQSTRKKK